MLIPAARTPSRSTGILEFKSYIYKLMAIRQLREKDEVTSVRTNSCVELSEKRSHKKKKKTLVTPVGEGDS